MKEVLLGLLRHVLTSAGAVIVANGLATQADASAIAGGVMALIGVVMSIKKNKK